MDGSNFRTWLELGQRIRVWWIQGPAAHVRSVKEEDAEYEEIAEHLTSITPEVDRTFSRAAHRAGFRATMGEKNPGALVVVRE
jgi:hypothetical protein